MPPATNSPSTHLDRQPFGILACFREPINVPRGLGISTAGVFSELVEASRISSSFPGASIRGRKTILCGEFTGCIPHPRATDSPSSYRIAPRLNQSERYSRFEALCWCRPGTASPAIQIEISPIGRILDSPLFDLVTRLVTTMQTWRLRFSGLLFLPKAIKMRGETVASHGRLRHPFTPTNETYRGV